MIQKSGRNTRKSQIFDGCLHFAATALLVSGMVAIPAMGEPIIETLSPNVYTVFAGEQFTISGAVLFPDAATYAYGEDPGDYLFGLTPTSPHLEIVAGIVESSTDFPMGSGGPLPAYFQDVFGQGGWLGPTPVNGPVTTAVAEWRTFIVPVGTSPGVYDYSYGISFTENGGAALGGINFATNLVVDVVSAPEPPPLTLAGLGLAVLVTCGCTMRERRKRY